MAKLTKKQKALDGAVDRNKLHGVDEAELRLHDAGVSLAAAELRADGLVQIHDVLHREVADAAVSR